MRVLREDVTPEEEVTLRQLSAIWEQRNLKPVPLQRRSRLSLKYLIYPAGIAAALLLAFGLGWHPLAPAPSKVAEFTKKLADSVRPFEPRIVGQRYLEIEETTRSPKDIVPDLLAEEMTEKSAESYEVGRYFLLKREYAKAIKHLKTAVADPNGVPANVHNDLGVAYLESGREHLVEAEAEFKEALNLNHVHKPAIFNLSILYERQGRVDEARHQWQQYLELDPDSGWAKEIEKKLSGKESAEQ